TTPLQSIRIDIILYNKARYIGARYIVHFIYNISNYYLVTFYTNKGNTFIIIIQFK
ncbi:hypothetical protein QR685DRAFT_436170, partial [Neurospora intermedia]